jgi:hypothetical protein
MSRATNETRALARALHLALTQKRIFANVLAWAWRPLHLVPRDRDELAAKMTPAQIAEAQRLASERTPNEAHAARRPLRMLATPLLRRAQGGPERRRRRAVELIRRWGDVRTGRRKLRLVRDSRQRERVGRSCLFEVVQREQALAKSHPNTQRKEMSGGACLSEQSSVAPTSGESPSDLRRP